MPPLGTSHVERVAFEEHPPPRTTIKSGKVARRVRVREVADAILSHALGELDCLLTSGGGALLLPLLPLPADVFEQPATIRASRARRPAAGALWS
jgi:hypothetical protein